jgi:LPXTG-site transpeptidase (sortase) family protein
MKSKAAGKKPPKKAPVKKSPKKPSAARATKATKSAAVALKKKQSFKRRYLPAMSGILVAILVFGFFNSQLLSSRIAYYLGSRQPAAALDSQTIASPISKNSPNVIIINSIGVNAPVIFENQNSENQFLLDLRSGVVHYPQTALPGQEGNVAIFGHSSGVWWEIGNYKFVFTLLDKVKVGDKVFIDYDGTRYIYRVYGTEVVPPTDLSVLDQAGGHMLTLITCTPVGTSTNRLIIHAVQYVPTPVNPPAATKPATLPAGATGVLPGNNSSLLSNLSDRL